MKPIILLALCAATAAAQAQVYRCTSPSGTVSMQQSPCDGSGRSQPLKLQPNVVEGNPAGDAGLRWRAERDRRVREAIRNGAVINGMTTHEVAQSIGLPDRINSSIGGGATRQQRSSPARAHHLHP